MNHKNLFRVLLVLVVLVGFSLSCKLVNDINELRSIATDIEAISTEFDIEGLVTDIDIESLVTEIDIEAMVTDIDIESLVTEVDIEALTTDIDLGSLETEMGGMLTDLPSFDETAQPATPSGFPADIPVMPGEVYDMTGSANRLEYSLDSDIAGVVDYYRRELAARGWVEASGSQVTDESAVLTFTNGSRTARLMVEEDFFFGVKVQIEVQGG